MTDQQATQSDRVLREAIVPDGFTAFGMDPVPGELVESIRALGITHPLVLIPHGDGFRVVCGHRRFQAAQVLGLDTVPAHLVEAMSDVDRLIWNLQENRAHRRYTDIEKGRILHRLHTAGIEEAALATGVLPILGEPKTRKRAVDLLSVCVFTESFQGLMHELNIPLRVFAVMAKWGDADRSVAESLFSQLRPGHNKWRAVLETVDEIATRDGIAPAEVLDHATIVKTLGNASLPANEKYDAIFSHLHSQRYPHLSDLQSRVRKAAERLQLDPKTKLKLPENFEQALVKIELKFSTEEELTRQVEKLFGACDADALKELLRTLKDPLA
ncbi:ParB/RepB/Spo0J family partition protein [Nitrospina gracilis]|uniref:ParB/RepB/Spo0J family partition protein n=1 Tax=Nitrospina gracilis TaxID=35801 RepID=UPI001F3B7056|nr:ParB N-terminal domain-containing protein [Nitrospina gracilis]MCF8719554.1 hypothetical protein [Nitrospina gracilis Nb-211]